MATITTSLLDTFWSRLSSFWAALALSFDVGVESTRSLASEDSRISLASTFGKLERNLVAGLQVHQEAVM